MIKPHSCRDVRESPFVNESMQYATHAFYLVATAMSGCHRVTVVAQTTLFYLIMALNCQSSNADILDISKTSS